MQLQYFSDKEEFWEDTYSMRRARGSIETGMHRRGVWNFHQSARRTMFKFFHSTGKHCLKNPLYAICSDSLRLSLHWLGHCWDSDMPASEAPIFCDPCTDHNRPKLGFLISMRVDSHSFLLPGGADVLF